MRTSRARRSIATAVATLLVIAAAGSATATAAEPTAQLALTITRTVATDLVHDPVRDVVYATIPSYARTDPNTVVALDPTTGAVLRSVPVGAHPWAIALSADGSALYVGHRDTHELVRIDPTSFRWCRRWRCTAPRSGEGP